MKLKVIDKTAKKVSELDFDLKGSIRDDIFKKAVLAESSLFYQVKGSDPQAGKKQVVNLSKRRKNFRTTYGRGGSRTPRKVMWARGTQFRYVGAWASQTVGGRKAHAPTAKKDTLKDINNKEWLLALKVGLLASLDNSKVSLNGQKVPETYPLVLDSSVEESLSKTKEVKEFLEVAGFGNELERISERKIRAGKGKMRNRRFKVKRGPLLVVSSLESPLLKASRNIRGLDVITSDLLMVSDFGMNISPGRAVIFTKPALEEFKEVFN